MHTLVVMERDEYRDNMGKLLTNTANEYERACYISFNDPYHVVIEMIQNANVNEDKFIIIDASGSIKNARNVDKRTYVLPVQDLFNVYLFLRGLIKDEKIKAIILDSVSALIYKYNELPLKEMLTELLLEIGTFKCDTSVVVFNEHHKHEVVTHLSPLIGRSLVL